MKKIILVFLMLSLAFSAAATTINSEEVEIDLNTKEVHANIEVDELTSSAFLYASSHEISKVEGTVNGRESQCQINDSAIGSEIRCPTDLKKNFTVNLDFKIEGTLSQRNEVKVFRYNHPVYRPTDSYSLKVLLPDGNALVKTENTTQQVISPLNYNTGSDGRQIFVEWESDPELGETLSFYILFENIQEQQESRISLDTVSKALIILLILIIVSGAIVALRRREDLSESMEDLSEDQKEIIEKIENNGGEYLQKDLVDEMDYSKAKISGEVSELVDKGILKKSKEGRSNKLSISRRYRY